MTKKDYILIAEAIEGTLNNSYQWEQREKEAIHEVAERIAEALQKDNTRFDSIRFLEACGVK